MVRCGVVAHPREWRWVGYHEIMGQRRRYRVVDLERLCWRLRAGSLDDLRRNLTASLEERIAQGGAKREPCWTESLAVGSPGFLESQPVRSATMGSTRAARQAGSRQARRLASVNTSATVPRVTGSKGGTP